METWRCSLLTDDDASRTRSDAKRWPRDHQDDQVLANVRWMDENGTYFVHNVATTANGPNQARQHKIKDMIWWSVIIVQPCCLAFFFFFFKCEIQYSIMKHNPANKKIKKRKKLGIGKKWKQQTKSNMRTENMASQAPIESRDYTREEWHKSINIEREKKRAKKKKNLSK